MIVSCYTLDLYCDGPHESWEISRKFPDQYTGRTLAACKRQAIHDGWRFTRGVKRDQKVLCAECVKAKYKPVPLVVTFNDPVEQRSVKPSSID